MEHFFELVLELLFGLAKDTPEKMPEIEYREHFLIKHPRKKALVRICTTLTLIIVFSLFWIFIKYETRYLFLVFVVLETVLLALFVYEFSFRCYVNDVEISRKLLGIFKKKIKWQDLRCVRVVEQTNERTVVIALYDQTGKCIMDFNTDMENTWYIVKTAEHKAISIKHEKDLSIKQLARL